MSRLLLLLLSASLGVALSSAARAEAKIITLDDSSARYSFRDVEEGYLRLDRQTGEIVLCAPAPVGWSCGRLAEQQRDDAQEISRLRAEIAELREALHEQATPPATPFVLAPAPPGVPEQTASISAPQSAPATPNDEASAKSDTGNTTVKSAVGPEPNASVIAEAWRRLLETMANLQRQLQ